MNHQSTEELAATLQPRDFAEDLEKGGEWLVCPECIRVYWGCPHHRLCHLCAPDKPKEGA